MATLMRAARAPPRDVRLFNSSVLARLWIRFAFLSVSRVCPGDPVSTCVCPGCRLRFPRCSWDPSTQRVGLGPNATHRPKAAHVGVGSIPHDLKRRGGGCRARPQPLYRVPGTLSFTGKVFISTPKTFHSQAESETAPRARGVCRLVALS